MSRVLFTWKYIVSPKGVSFLPKAVSRSCQAAGIGVSRRCPHHTQFLATKWICSVLAAFPPGVRGIRNHNPKEPSGQATSPKASDSRTCQLQFLIFSTQVPGNHGETLLLGITPAFQLKGQELGLQSTVADACDPRHWMGCKRYKVNKQNKAKTHKCQLKLTYMSPFIMFVLLSEDLLWVQANLECAFLLQLP